MTEGTLSIRVGDEWVEAPRGTFIRVPAGVIHDFENRTSQAATLFNVFLPGGFEPMMPAIVSWFAENAGKEPGA